jgi:triosephosphate isomerase
LIAGNWKMNGLQADGMALAEAIAGLVSASRTNVEIVLCPPATLLATIAERLKGRGIGLGGQDCHAKPSGAFTGDIAAPMLRDAGCSHVILGHSERRVFHHETDADIAAKGAAALSAGLTIILCVGETEPERDAGHTLQVVERQITHSLPPGADALRIILAYEPIWAIGTGRTPTLAEIAAVHGHARSLLAGLLPDGAATRILYGGSVKPGNAREVLALADVDGALVGGASLVASDFIAIVNAVSDV